MKHEIVNKIMKLDTQLCPPELAKDLVDLGVKKDSIFYWEVHPQHGTRLTMQKYNEMATCLPAYSVAELGEMLPFEICPVGRLHVEVNMQDGMWYAWVFPGAHTIKASTEAVARAKALIYLLKANLITV